MSVSRIILIALACAALSPAGAVAGPKALAPYTTGVAFAHLHSDIAPDPAVRFGRLPNGLTYMITRTKAPVGAASIQMRIDGGYLDAAEDEQGLDFMLVRLAFDGSAGITPKDGTTAGDLHGWLAERGMEMRLGRDVTLSTDTTKYQLALPRADRQGLDDGLFALRQIASELTLPQEAITVEGVTAAGLALNAASQSRAFDALRTWTFEGQAYARRTILGAQDVVLYTDKARMTAFYRARYRPETTTLIMAGDFDPDLAEQRLKSAFGSWKSTGTVATEPDYGAPVPQTARATVISFPGAPQLITASWTTPADEGFQTYARARTSTLQSMAISALNDRLDRLKAAPDSHLLEAAVETETIAHTGRSYALAVRAKPGEDAAALREALAAVQQFRVHGLTQGEIDLVQERAFRVADDKVVAEVSADADSRVRSLSDSLDRKAVVNSAAQDRAFLQGLAADMNPASFTPLIKTMLAGDPAIALLGQGYGALDEARILADYHAVLASAPPPPQDVVRVAWPYTQFGAPAALTKTETLARSGVTHLTYANGLEVYLRPRRDVADDIAVRVSVRGGLALFPADTRAPLFIVNNPSFSDGSLGQISNADVGTIRAGRRAMVNFGVQDTVSVLDGRTNGRDLAFHLQILMAYLTDFKLNAVEFDRAQAGLAADYTGLTANPQKLMASQAGRWLRGDDRRFGISAPADAAAMTRAEAQAVFDRVLGQGPVTVSIAGDFDPEVVRALIDQTFAALPPRPKAVKLEPAVFARGLDKTLRYPTDTPGSLFMLAWPTTDYYSDLKTSVALRVMIRVLDERFFARHKQDYGMSTDAMFDNWQSNDRPGDGYISVSMPSFMSDDDSRLTADIAAAFEDMKTQPATEAELERARAWLVRFNDDLLRSNGYWAVEMSHFDHATGEADLTDYNDLVRATTADDVAAVAKAYLKAADTLHIRLVPMDTSGGNAS